jgi:hypothetical protein
LLSKLKGIRPYVSRAREVGVVVVVASSRSAERFEALK